MQENIFVDVTENGPRELSDGRNKHATGPVKSSGRDQWADDLSDNETGLEEDDFQGCQLVCTSVSKLQITCLQLLTIPYVVFTYIFYLVNFSCAKSLIKSCAF